MRICRSFRDPGTRIYYRRNAFRFSNSVSLFVLSHFLGLIRLANVKALRDIALVYPDQAHTFMTDDNVLLFEKHLRAFGIPCGSVHAHDPDHANWSVLSPPARRCVLRKLRDIEKLTTLTLVILLNEPDVWHAVETLELFLRYVASPDLLAADLRGFVGTDFSAFEKCRFLWVSSQASMPEWDSMGPELGFTRDRFEAVMRHRRQLGVAGAEVADVTVAEYEASGNERQA